MKNMSRIAITVILLSITFFVKAQVTAVEPEFANTIVHVKNSSVPQELERQTFKSKSSTSASSYILGVGKTKLISYVEGEQSPIRIVKRDSIQFIVRVKDNSLNPAEAIRLTKFSINQKKKFRFVEAFSVGAFSGVQNGESEAVKFGAVKYGSNSYLLTVRNLQLGEYFFSILDAGENVQMFGIDR